MYSESNLLSEMCMDTINVTLKHACGYSDVKKSLCESLQTSAWADSSQKPLLLFGHPGVGKTFLLRALAAEVKVKLLVSSPYAMRGPAYPKDFSDSLKVMFSTARANRPCILNFEDLHVLWSDGEDQPGWREEFLSQLQQFRASQSQDSSAGENSGVTFIASSTSPWLIDPKAIKMFKLIYVDLPGKETRRDMIRFNFRDTGHNLTDDELNELSEKTAGFTGSDICCLVKDAAMQGIRNITNAKFFKKVLVTREKPQGINSTQSEADTSTDAVAAAASSLETQNDPSQYSPHNSGREEKNTDQDLCLVEKFVPCQETDEGASQISMWDLDPDMIQEPQVTFENMEAALARTKPSVAAQEVDRMVHFARNAGTGSLN